MMKTNQWSLEKAIQGTNLSLGLLVGLLAGLVIAVSAASTANAAELRVPSEYPTIQAAIDAATDGDTVLVAEGLYSGSGNTILTFPNLTLTLTSESGPINCVIDCENQSVFCDINNVTTGILTIQGFTVINGYTHYNGGSAIHSINSSPIIRNCTFRNNGSLTEDIHEGAMYFVRGQPVIDQCIFEDNQSGLNGGAIAFYDSDPTVTRCIFTRNEAFYGGAIYLYRSAAVIGGTDGMGNTFDHNWAPYGADLYSDSIEIQDARFNHFDGTFLSDFRVLPGALFDLNGCTTELAPIESDVYVSPTGDDSNDGLTVANPFRTIRHALSRIIASQANPLTIHLAAGVFSIENSGQTYPIPLLDHIRIAGAGPNQTILDGTGASNLFVDLLGTGTVLDSLRISNAGARALNIEQTELSIQSCHFIENTVMGAIEATRHSVVSASDSVFEHNRIANSGANGAAIWLSFLSTATFDGCRFTGNESRSYGGAIQLDTATLVMRHCLFNENSAKWRGGAINAEQKCSVTLEDSEFVNNSATYSGGAISSSGIHSGIIRRCVFRNNTMPITEPWGYGGAVYFSYSDGTESCSIQESTFENNQAAWGGAVFVAEDCITSIETSRFEGNRAFAGGAIGVQNNKTTIGGSPGLGNVFIDNVAGAGADLFAYTRTGDVLDARFNSFSGNIHSDWTASPPERFDLTGSTGAIEPVYANMYVSPLGDDQNSGLTPDEPLRSLTSALRRIVPTETEPLTLYIAAGNYSEFETSEQFPLQCLPHLTMQTTGEGFAVISGNRIDPVWVLAHEEPVLENMVIRQGSRGIVCLANSLLTMRNSWITDNATAGSGGGIWSIGTCGLILEDCRLTENSADGSGGALYSAQSQSSWQSLQLWNCAFQDNSADTGGAIYQWGGRGYVSACTFTGNHAREGGGFHGDSFVGTRIENCLFDSNTADVVAGGVFAQDNSGPYVRYCTFVNNDAPYGGGGLLSRWSQPVINHCIFWNNSTNQVQVFGYSVTLTNSVVQGGFEGTGNIDADPLFITGPMGGYYLSQIQAGQSADSPAVDAGALASDAAMIRSPSGDVPMSGFTTRTDHVPDSGTLDIGYHYPETIPPPDPPCVNFGCQIEMPSHYFQPGDDLYCRVVVCNSTPQIMTSMPVFVILELAGSYFFAPGFSSFDIYLMDLESGETIIDVLPQFTWPEGAGSFDDACWYAAVTDRDMTMILGVLDIFRFGWGEGDRRPPAAVQ